MYFFESGILKVNLLQLRLKCLLNNLRGTLTTAFRKTPCMWKFYGHGPKDLRKRNETKIDEGAWKYQLHKNPSLHFEELYTKLDYVLFIFSFHLGFKFNIALIGILDNLHHFEVYTVPLRFYIRTSKILMRLDVLFFEGFHPQNSYFNKYFFLLNCRGVE